MCQMSKSDKKWPSYSHSKLGQKWRPGLFRAENVGGVGILVIDTSPRWRFEIWPFYGFLETKVVNLGPIDF